MKPNYQDLIGGISIFALGMCAAVYTYYHYPLGTFSNMGSGMFPFGLGLLLIVFGATIFVFAAFRGGGLPVEFDIRAACWILVSISLFAVTVDKLGLAPSVFMATCCATMAGGKLRVPAVIALATVTTVSAVGIFIWGLDMPIPVANW